MAHRVDAHGDREHERLVLARGDLDPVGVADPEPLFDTSATVSPSRSISYSWSTRLPLASMSAPPSTSIDEAVADADERLLDGRERAPVALDLHLVAHGELALLELGDLAAGRVLEHERLADPQRLAVDAVGAAAVLGSIQ